jgi:hypothetical protein
VTIQPWPIAEVDAIYCANVIHIAPWRVAEALFSGAGDILRPGKLLITYGPYKYEGKYTSESNAYFDQSLRARNPQWGIRDIEDLAELGKQQGLTLESDTAMPANNQFLVWRKG